MWNKESQYTWAPTKGFMFEYHRIVQLEVTKNY